jgi:FAD/FMN-containing dehydrogenase
MASTRAEQTLGVIEKLVAAGLEQRILLPNSPDFLTRNNSYWCNNAKLNPACIVQPLSTEEVGVIIRTLAASNQQFAVRGGGHSNWAGSNNIEGGITVDLGLMNATNYDPATELAHIQPGSTWKDVYAELGKHGRVVAGGREAEVGVGGFLLGGGNTFYTSHNGLACDNVVAYRVVLADGHTVTAEAEGEYRGEYDTWC